MTDSSVRRKDSRLFAKFALDFSDHPKIAILSDAAYRCLVDATIWSRKQETDGFLARRLALAKWSLEVLQELCANDDENPSLIECPEGWYIHDYAEHQDTKAEIAARRAHAKTAGQKGGLARAKQTAKRPAKRRPSKPLSKTQAETETDITLDTDVSSVGATTKNRRGTRLPEGWKPDPDVIDAMRRERPDVDLQAEHRKFTDHFKAKAGRDGTKLDWNATWRNWIRNARGAPPGPRPATNGGNHDQKVNHYLHMPIGSERKAIG